jgi:hypothetical protein
MGMVSLEDELHFSQNPSNAPGLLLAFPRIWREFTGCCDLPNSHQMIKKKRLPRPAV